MFMHPGAFMRNPYGGGHGRRGGGFGLLMLAAAVHRIGIHNIPAVTLGVLGANVACYLGLIRGMARGAWAVCLSPQAVVGGEWWRMLTHLFYHADDIHLSYNMTSFLWKGVNLERALGTSKFLSMLLSLSLLTPIVHVMLAFAMHELRLDVYGLFQECAVGYSGVVFALKVITTIHSYAMHDVFFGMFSVQGKYVVWVELILIHFLRPGTSFVGHLAGILAGLAYAFGYLDPIAGPLERCVDAVFGAVSRAVEGYNNMPRGGGGGGGGYGGGAPPPRAYHAGGGGGAPRSSGSGYDDPRAQPPPPQPPGPDPQRDRVARQRAADAAARRFQTGGY